LSESFSDQSLGVISVYGMGYYPFTYHHSQTGNTNSIFVGVTNKPFIAAKICSKNNPEFFAGFDPPKFWYGLSIILRQQDVRVPLLCAP